MSKKILITGSGISGTTFLWYLMQEVGYITNPPGITADTYELLRYPDLVDSIVKGKFQWPQVIKHLGGFMVNMNEHIDRYEWKVQHVFICVRRMKRSIEKRGRRKLVHKSLNVELSVFEKMTLEEKQDKMREILKIGIGSVIFNLLDRDYPFTLIRFPRDIIDAEYCFEKVQPVLMGQYAQFDNFKKAWDRARRSGTGIEERHFEEEEVQPPEDIVKWWNEKK